MCVLDRAGGGWRLRGTVPTHEAKKPIEPLRTVDWPGRPRTSSPGRLRGGDPRELPEIGELWSGKERPPEYEDCADVDLSFTPATNTLPIRRLGLGVGEKADIAVAWLRWPELKVERVGQRYARLAADRYRYTQGDFEAELTVDEHGLVLEYDGLWKAIARA